MKAISLFFIFLSSSTWAATNVYELQIDLTLNQKPTISKQLSIADGSKVTISEEGKGVTTTVEVTAKEGAIQNTKGIVFDLVIGTIAKDGKKTILSRPQILAKENEPAEITSANNENEISLSLLVKRQK